MGDLRACPQCLQETVFVPFIAQYFKGIQCGRCRYRVRVDMEALVIPPPGPAPQVQPQQPAPERFYSWVIPPGSINPYVSPYDGFNYKNAAMEVLPKDQKPQCNLTGNVGYNVCIPRYVCAALCKVGRGEQAWEFMTKVKAVRPAPATTYQDRDWARAILLLSMDYVDIR